MSPAHLSTLSPLSTQVSSVYKNDTFESAQVSSAYKKPHYAHLHSEAFCLVWRPAVGRRKVSSCCSVSSSGVERLRKENSGGQAVGELQQWAALGTCERQAARQHRAGVFFCVDAVKGIVLGCNRTVLPEQEGAAADRECVEAKAYRECTPRED